MQRVSRGSTWYRTRLSGGLNYDERKSSRGDLAREDELISERPGRAAAVARRTGPVRGVSCPAAGFCAAVGSYQPPGAIQVSIAEMWDGSTWKTQPFPVPASSFGVTLTAVVHVAPFLRSGGTLFRQYGRHQCDTRCHLMDRPGHFRVGQCLPSPPSRAPQPVPVRRSARSLTRTAR